jgi:hypothetical protein
MYSSEHHHSAINLKHRVSPRHHEEPTRTKIQTCEQNKVAKKLCKYISMRMSKYRPRNETYSEICKFAHLEVLPHLFFKIQQLLAFNFYSRGKLIHWTPVHTRMWRSERKKIKKRKLMKNRLSLGVSLVQGGSNISDLSCFALAKAGSMASSCIRATIVCNMEDFFWKILQFLSRQMHQHVRRNKDGNPLRCLASALWIILD